MKITRYSAYKKQNILTIFKEIFQEFPKANALGYRLAVRNIKAKYRQSMFGLFWALLPPLATSIIWIFLRGQGVVEFEETGVAYPVFVVAGTFIWQMFSLSINLPMQTVKANKSILTKINFPRESLFYSSLYEIGFNILLSFIVVIVAMVYFGAFPGIEGLLFIPLLLLLLIMGLAISLIIMPIATLYSDIQFALPTFLQFLMYLTPVIYPQPLYTGFGKILEFNPISPLLTATRNFLLGIPNEIGSEILIGLGIGIIILFLIGILLMRLTMEILIERMGS